MVEHGPSIVAPERVQLAVARIGKTFIGIEALYVAQATVAPESNRTLPRRSGALAGVIRYRSLNVPVVDLRRWVDLGTADVAGAPQRVIVLQAATRTVGLIVDEIVGLSTVERTQIEKLVHDDNAEEVFHSVVSTGENNQLLNLLDCESLMVLAAAWVKADSEETEVTDTSHHIVETRSTVSQPSYALFELGSSIVAVEASAVAEVFPMPPLHKFESRNVVGLCDWRDRKAIILSPNTILGQRDPVDYPLVAIFMYQGLALGIPVQRATRLTQAPDLTKAVSHSDFVQIFYDNEENKLHVIDTAKLFAAFPEASISSHTSVGSTRPLPIDQTGRTRSDNNTGFIAYEADGYAALPLTAIEEILPGSILNVSDSPGTVMQWRGRALHLIDLRTNTVKVDDTVAQDGHIIVLRKSNDFAALLVHRVCTLIPPGTGEIFKMRLAGINSRSFLTTGQNADKVSYVVMDPEQMV